MADEFYVRFACVACDVGFHVRAGLRGRPRKKCPACAPSKAGPHPPKSEMAQVCRQCERPFQSARIRIHCSKKCAETSSALARRDRQKQAQGRVHIKVCANCQKVFEHPWRSVVMYCSNACKVSVWAVRSGRKRSVEQLDALRLEKAQAKLRAAHLAEERAATIAARRAANEMRLSLLRSRPCALCRAPVGSTTRHYCSDVCLKSRPRTDAEIAGKRESRAKRRAVERRAFVEQFNPFDVFDRDGWRCQICGAATPKRLRGTFKANAPELDHVVPLAQGGAHSLANTQCACRKCNGKKSDKTVVGQLGLFTSLMNESISARRRPRRTANT